MAAKTVTRNLHADSYCCDLCGYNRVLSLSWKKNAYAIYVCSGPCELMTA